MIKEMNIVKKFIRNLILMTILHFDIKPAQRKRFLISILTKVTLQGLLNGDYFIKCITSLSPSSLPSFLL